MEKKRDWPKRKTTRLKSFDYSSARAYFVTICTRDRMQLLSEIIPTNRAPLFASHAAADRAAPEIEVRLKPCGEIAEEQLHLLETRFPSVTVEDYVIMPDHIHAIIFLHRTAAMGELPAPGCGQEARPAPTLGEVICAFKSLTSRRCKQSVGVEKMFQRSSVEHIIRDREDYETRRRYIYENPMRWYYKRLGEGDSGSPES